MIFKLIFVLLSAGAPAQAERYLMIGDSHSCGRFGQELSRLLVARGHEIELYCAVSSAAVHWVEGTNPKSQVCRHFSNAGAPELCGGDGQVPRFAALRAQYPDRRVIIALGTNSLLDTVADRFYAELAAEVGGIGCDWITPPHLRPDQARGFSPARLRLMESHLDTYTASLPANCRFIDSRPSTTVGQPGSETLDGVHRTADGGDAWASEIAKGF